MILLGLLFSLLAATSQAASIVHSNDVLGEIEPCGCRTNPLGGYARKANFLKGFKADELIQLDAGDLLFPSDVTPEILKKQSFLQAQWILKILDLMHHDAVTPGEKDFSLGVAAFRKLLRGTKVKFIAANLYSGGKKLLPDSVILTRKRADGSPVRVAVLGLVGEDLPWPDSLHATDPIAAAKKLVPELRKKADWVVALTHEGLEADKKLAQAVSGIDIIFGAHTQSFLQIPLKIGKTSLYQSSFRNQYLGVADLDHGTYKLVGLDPAYDSPSEMPGAVDRAVTQFKADIAKLNAHDADDAAFSVPMNHSRFQTFPRCAECHLKQFDFWRKTPHAMALAPLVKAGQDKNKECLLCHTVGLGDSKGFRNVNQLAELTAQPRFLPTGRFVDYLTSMHDAKSLNDPIRGLSSGSSTSKADITLNQSLGRFRQAWAPVQCENCHGPGENHPMSGNYSKKVETRVCLACHTSTRAPEWYKADGQPDWEKIKAKHARISCPAGDFEE